jgi:hypothetical protein
MNAITFIVAIIVGLITIIVLFALRFIGLIACVIGGFALLATAIAAAVYTHAPTAAHGRALAHTGGLLAACLGVTIAAWFGPMWLLRESPTAGSR